MFSLKNIDVVDFGGAPASNGSMIRVNDLLSEEQLINHVLFEDDFSNSARNGNKIPIRVQEKNKVGISSVDNGDLSASRKLMHRETEKQRRGEMANLYASLTSLLPPQYIKGKRSIPDHVREVVNYIKNTQKKIEELQTDREKLRKVFNNSWSGEGEISSTKRVSFTVNVYGHGAEILISTGPDEEERGVFSPLKIVKVLSELGHDIVSYVSTKAHGGISLHRIQLEDCNITTMDLTELQERLSYVINHSYCC